MIKYNRFILEKEKKNKQTNSHWIGGRAGKEEKADGRSSPVTSAALASFLVSSDVSSGRVVKFDCADDSILSPSGKLSPF